MEDDVRWVRCTAQHDALAYLYHEFLMLEVVVVCENRVLVKSLGHLLRADNQIKPRFVYYSADAYETSVTYKPSVIILDSHVMVPIRSLLKELAQCDWNVNIIVIDDKLTGKGDNNINFLCRENLNDIVNLIKSCSLVSENTIYPALKRQYQKECDTRKVPFVENYGLYKDLIVSSLKGDSNSINETVRLIYFDKVSKHYIDDIIPQMRGFAAFLRDTFGFMLGAKVKEVNDTFVSIENEYDEMNHFFTQLSIEQKNINLSENVRSSVIYIFNNYDKELSLEDMAEYLNRSKSYLSRVFKSEVGMTFLELLQSLRIFIAKQYLFECQYKISDISVKVGYVDPHYFSRLFKKHTGYSPKEYRDYMRT